MDHHAICYIGHDFGRYKLKEKLEQIDVDLSVEEFTNFGIDDARRLSKRAYTAPVAAKVQTFILIINNITHEAQNALLKLFEEPPERSVFDILIPKKGLLLPTLQSRLHFLEDDSFTNNDAVEFENLASLPVAERLTLVGTLAKNKDVKQIEEFVTAAELLVSQTGDTQALVTVMFVRDHIGRRGASTKMLLELLSLAVPVT